MFGDIGWAELMIIAVVALIVIGPKDLPEMFRQLGRVTSKIRAMARDFSRAMEQAAKESGVSDVAKDMRAATSPTAMGLDKVRAAADKFEKWDPLKPAKPAVKPLTPPPMPPASPVAAAAGEPVLAEPITQPAAVAKTAIAAKKAAPKPKLASPKTASLKPASQEAAHAETPPSVKIPRKKAEPK
jgi:sec-independent protein translocase protein TatB